MNRTYRVIGLLAVVSLAMTAPSPSAVAGLPDQVIDPAAATGIQLRQPAADTQKVGAVLQAVVVASDRFSSFGFVGAQVGDKVAVTVLAAGEKWSVTNLRTGAVQTIGFVNQKLAVVPTASANPQLPAASGAPINQQLAAAPTGPVSQSLAAAPSGSANPRLAIAPTGPVNPNLAVAPTAPSAASLTVAPTIANAYADGGDVVVAWWGVRGAVAFELFRSANPAPPGISVAKLSSTSLGYRDKGAGAGPFYYQVVAVAADGTRMASAWFPFPRR